MNANLAANFFFAWQCVFEIKILIGLRQAFMAFMRWAIDVPHKQRIGQFIVGITYYKPHRR